MFLTAFKIIESDRKTVNCEHCGKGFVVHRYLQDHINTHTGVEAHVCKVCGKRCELCFHNVSFKKLIKANS